MTSRKHVVRICTAMCSKFLVSTCFLLAVLLSVTSIVLLSTETLPVEARMNVLFIVIDDLRTELGAYGEAHVKSPNIDQLASKSLVFERAYSQVALCSPSRTSVLTGRRPDTNHVWLNEYWRTQTNATTLPQYFKESGYVTIGMGKIFHPGAPSGDDDIAYSWSLPYYHSSISEDYEYNRTSSWWSFDGFADDQLPDGQIADKAISTLRELKQNKTDGIEKPFFLAVGFHKPHLPFYAPKTYFDWYPDPPQIMLPANPHVPDGMPVIARAFCTIPRYKDLEPLFPNPHECYLDSDKSLYGEECRMPDSKTRELRRAYYACISYTDAMVGKVLLELEESGFANETVIVLWADHGWQLGEHNHWCKFTNFEDSTHVPFMIRVPGLTDHGLRTKALVELIDIFPTVTELAGLTVPIICPEDSMNDNIACVESTSLVALLSNPEMEWKKAAFSQYARPAMGLRSIPGMPAFNRDQGPEDVMGYTIRTDKFRFTEWYRFNRTTGQPYWDEIWGTELYNHTQPTVFFNDENVNLATHHGMANTVKKLRRQLQAGWRFASQLNTG